MPFSNSDKYMEPGCGVFACAKVSVSIPDIFRGECLLIMKKTEASSNSCADDLRLELFFPSCWNGKDLDTRDHKSHMAYSSLVTDGGCPTAFDVWERDA